MSARRAMTVMVTVGLLAVPLLFVLYQAASGWPVLAGMEAEFATPPSTPVAVSGPSASPTPRQRADALATKGIELLQEGNAQAAALLFENAVSLDPKSADGNYGLGYTLLHQGDPNGALPYICIAARTTNGAAQRQAQELLRAHSLVCP